MLLDSIKQIVKNYLNTVKIPEYYEGEIVSDSPLAIRITINGINTVIKENFIILPKIYKSRNTNVIMDGSVKQIKLPRLYNVGDPIKVIRFGNNFLIFDIDFTEVLTIN